MVVLVNAGLGGMTQPPAATPTSVWGWTGREWRVLDSTGPPIRNLAGVTYDTKRQALVMHGGSYDLGRMYGETWEWTRGSWRQISGSGPGARDHTQMAFDQNRGRAVLFGGGGTDPNVVFGDTWEFDGAAWTRVATSGPAARVHHTMHYDPVSQRVVLFGGVAPGAGTFNDTWNWDGTRWARDDAAAPSRSHARMAFHRGLNALVVAGGLPALSDLGLLRRTGAAWTALASPAGPGPRYLAEIAYDERRNVLVLFGGGGVDGMSVFDDTWEFDGKTWKRFP